MTEHRLATEMWVSAYIRRADGIGDPVVLSRRGDAVRGTVLLKINGFERGWRVVSQARDLDGELGWLPAPDISTEDTAEAYVARALKRDPDLWVVEVEDRAGRHPLDGRTL